MELSRLLSTLSKNSYQYPFHIYPADILDFRLLENPQKRYFPNILYLGPVSALPELNDRMPLLNFFVYGPGKIPDSYRQYKVNLILLAEGFSPLSIYDELRLLLEISSSENTVSGKKSDSLLSNEWSIFLASLLSVFQPQPHVIEHECARMKFRLRGRYYLASVQAEEGRFSQETLHTLARSFYALDNKILPFVYQFQLVLFFNFSSETAIRPELLKELQEIAIRYHIQIGLSNPFTSLTEIRHYYIQACRAVTLANEAPKHTPWQPLFLYQEASYGELFSLCSSHADLRNYIYPPLMDLLEYDRINGTHLMDTLFEYLQHNTNSKETAESMFMHKNTVLYRLNKIKEILQFDLSVGEDVFIIALSIRILIYLRIFIPQKIIGEYEAEIDPS